VGPSAGAKPDAAGTTSPGAAIGPQGKPISVEVGSGELVGSPYAGAKAADGSIYDQNAMTAAHRELPLGAIVRVTNLSNTSR